MCQHSMHDDVSLRIAFAASQSSSTFDTCLVAKICFSKKSAVTAVHSHPQEKQPNMHHQVHSLGSFGHVFKTIMIRCRSDQKHLFFRCENHEMKIHPDLQFQLVNFFGDDAFHHLLRAQTIHMSKIVEQAASINAIFLKRLS